jgi:tetratricopeptide (TPR) repeat protein
MRRLAITLSFLVAALLAPALLGAQTGPGARDFEAGRAQMRASQPDRAERSFERAIEKEPRNGTYHLWLGNALGQQAATASVVRQPFLARRIKAAFERAVELDPELLDAREGVLQFHLFAPAVMGGDKAEARRQQREIARRDPARGHVAAANIAWSNRDTATTERELRAAIGVQPDSLAATATLASRLVSWKRSDEAFTLWDRYLARQPNSVPARYQYGRLAAITGTNLPQAERHFRAILAIDAWPEATWSMPSRAVAHARLGDVLRQQGKRDEARTAYDRALALDPNSQVAKDGKKALGS